MTEPTPDTTPDEPRGNQGNRGGAVRGQDRADQVHARNAERQASRPEDDEAGENQDPQTNAAQDGTSVDTDGDGVHDGVK